MKWIKRLLWAVALLYGLGAVVLYLAQERLIFHPHPLAADHRYGDHPDEWIDLPDGERLHALRLRAPDARGVVLFLHGNVGSNGRSLYQTRALRGLGYDLFLVDYRGFGKSSGEIRREADMTEDFQAVYDRLRAEYGEDRIYLMGYSLGTGPASYLAARNRPAGVLLVAPFRSLTAMKNEFFWWYPDFLLKYPLDNAAHLAAATCPVVIVHGLADELIPVGMSRELAAIDPGRIRLVELPRTGHRRAILHEGTAAAVRAFLR